LKQKEIKIPKILFPREIGSNLNIKLRL